MAEQVYWRLEKDSKRRSLAWSDSVYESSSSTDFTVTRFDEHCVRKSPNHSILSLKTVPVAQSITAVYDEKAKRFKDPH